MHFYQFDFLFLAALIGLILQGQLLPAIDFMFRHPDCFYDVAILSSVSKIEDFNLTSIYFY